LIGKNSFFTGVYIWCFLPSLSIGRFVSFFSSKYIKSYFLSFLFFNKARFRINLPTIKWLVEGFIFKFYPKLNWETNTLQHLMNTSSMKTTLFLLIQILHIVVHQSVYQFPFSSLKPIPNPCCQKWSTWGMESSQVS